MTKRRIFLDCDGVLADFDGGFKQLIGCDKPEDDDKIWELIAGCPWFFRQLPLKSDAQDLVTGVRTRGFEPMILTGVPRSIPYAGTSKRVWALEHFPNLNLITTKSRLKCEFARPGDILIDDRPKHRAKWIDAGGVWITHKSAEQSLMGLDEALGLINPWPIVGH